MQNGTGASRREWGRRLLVSVVLLLLVPAGRPDPLHPAGGLHAGQPAAQNSPQPDGPPRDSAGKPTGEDPLLPLRGHRTMVELPPLERVGEPLPAPRGWRSTQVTTATFDAFRRLLPEGETVGILFLDEHGNLAGRLVGDGARSRAARGIREAEALMERWGARLRAEATAAREAREAASPARELRHLIALRDAGLRGYPEVERARERLREVEVELARELWRALAGEGRVSDRTLVATLEQLRNRSRGLWIEAIVEEERRRVEDGRVVHPRRQPAPEGEAE
ncbi:MAG: hypothetical protein ACO4BJ_12560 [Planctomycetota bacterium]|jgi:hypothetical protein